MKQQFWIRIGALCLCLVMLAGFSSCAAKNPSTPDGMQIATVKGADFRLYIPTSWNVNTGYGVSGGYYTLSGESDSLSDQSTVSMLKYPISEEMANLMQTDLGENAAKKEARARWFFENNLIQSVEKLVVGEIVELSESGKATTLGKLNARQYLYRATIHGEKLQFLQVIAEEKGAFYVFSFTATEGLYEMLAEDVKKIMYNITYGTPYEPTEPVKEIDETAWAPEGMKLASNSDVAYSFYVPTDWSVNPMERIYSAYAKDGSVVSVIPYVPSGEGISLLEYWGKMEEMMEKTADDEGYTLHKKIDTKATLGKGNALRCEYSYCVDGIEYRYLHIIGSSKGSIYNLTYTALPEHYESNLAAVEQIIQAFVFR